MLLGLKIWSTNVEYKDSVLELANRNIFDYVELFSVPASYDKYHEFWKDLKSILNMPIIIHAPHYSKGLNLSIPDYSHNENMVNEAIQYADLMDSKSIIFHPGCNGHISETIRQINKIDDNRLLIENKPKIGIDGITKCVGYTPEHIKDILDNTSCGFCFDIGHAICAANSLGIDKFTFLNNLNKLSPAMYHLSDGTWESEIDSHLHYREGNYPIKSILKNMNIGKNSMISIETKKNSVSDLSDFKNDACYLKALNTQ